AACSLFFPIANASVMTNAPRGCVMQITHGKQPKLEIRHRFAGEGVLMFSVEELQKAVDDGQCDSTVVQCTIEREHIAPVVPRRPVLRRSPRAISLAATADAQPRRPPPTLEPAMLELLIKNVTRNATLEPAEISVSIGR